MDQVSICSELILQLDGDLSDIQEWSSVSTLLKADLITLRHSKVWQSKSMVQVLRRVLRHPHLRAPNQVQHQGSTGNLPPLRLPRLFRLGS